MAEKNFLGFTWWADVQRRFDEKKRDMLNLVGEAYKILVYVVEGREVE